MTINLNRTQSDDFEDFRVMHSIEKNPTYPYYDYPYTMPYNTRDPISAANVILRLETAANIYTRIRWVKTQRGDIINFYGTNAYVDSLICRQNKDNIFNVDY